MASQATPADIDQLRGEWNRIAQVREFIEECKLALQQKVAAEQASGSQVLIDGDVVEVISFKIFVDRPVVKERTTTLLERISYEREYLRETKLINEVNLPTYIEELSRRTTTPNGVHQGQRLVAVGQQPEAGLAPSGAAPARVQPDPTDTLPEASRVLTQPAGGSSQPATLESRFQGDNPFKDLVQTPESVENEPLTPTDEQGGSLEQNADKASRKKRFGLKWFFSAPFSDGRKEDRGQESSQLEGASEQPRLDGGGSTEQKLLEGPGPEADPRSQTELHQNATAEQGIGQSRISGVASQPEDSVRPSQQAETSRTILSGTQTTGEDASRSGIDQTVSLTPEQAVRLALMNDAADETQQEYFTQIEEQRITRERVERFVEHQYFALAYVMRVVFRGEKVLPSSIEILNRNQFLMEGSRQVQAVPIATTIQTPAIRNRS